MKIKICGLFRTCDIEYVNQAQPDYIGFVFAKSKRQVTFLEAMELRKNLKEHITPVGVFVNAPQEEIIRLYQQGVIAMAQLHGDENEDYIKSLKNACGIPVIKAVGVKNAEDIEIWQESCGDYLLFDQVGGGTGKVFDWSLIPQCKKPFFLAGGMRSELLPEALKISPYAVDISSGVETEGKKDKNKILEFVRKARGGV